MSPLRNYSSITNGGSNDVCEPFPSPALRLSSCSVLACGSQSPVRQILINWLLVDVSVTHLQKVFNLRITPELVRQLIQSVHPGSIGWPYSPPYDWNKVIWFQKVPAYPRGRGSSAPESVFNLKVWQIQEVHKRSKFNLGKLTVLCENSSSRSRKSTGWPWYSQRGRSLLGFYTA